MPLTKKRIANGGYAIRAKQVEKEESESMKESENTESLDTENSKEAS